MSPVVRMTFVLTVIFALTSVNCSPGEHCEDWTHAICEAQGSVQVAAPTLSIPASVPATTNGRTCEDKGMCLAYASVSFWSRVRGTEDSQLYVGFQVQPDASAGVFTLVGKTLPVHVLPLLYNRTYPHGDKLVVRAGELAISRTDRHSFTGTFAMELDSTDGLHHLSLTSGDFTVGDCVSKTETFCGD